MTALIPRPSPLEAALDAATAARLALPAHLAGVANDPWRCPAGQLGFLAWSLSLELWDDGWPELKKRQVCANALQLHRQKTTLAGIRAHVALVDAEVRGAVRPPARGFWRSAISDEARVAHLAALPQVRLYPFAHGGIARQRTFLSSRAARRGYHGHGWLRSSRGPQLLGIHATFWNGATEQPIATIEREGPLGREIRALIPAVRPRRRWHGHGSIGGYLRASLGQHDVVAFRPSAAAASFALSRGAVPLAIAPLRVFPQRVAPRHRSFFGRAAGGDRRARPLRFLQTSVAPQLVYDRYPVADPNVGIATRRVRTWHGHGRFGIRAFTAELQIAVPMARPRLNFDRWHGRGFTRTTDHRPLARAVEAVRVSKAARDTILIDTASHGPATFRGGLRFGDPDFPAFGARMRNF